MFVFKWTVFWKLKLKSHRECPTGNTPLANDSLAIHYEVYSLAMDLYWAGVVDWVDLHLGSIYTVVSPSDFGVW